MNTYDILNDNVFVEPSSESSKLSVNNSDQKVGGTPSPTGYRDYEPPTELLDNDYQTVSHATHGFRNLSSRKDKETYSEITHKTILLGDSGVGKTSLLVQFDTGTFQPRNFAATVGIGFTNKIVSVDGTQVKLQIWDTAGQERFRSVTHAYYRDAHALLLLYDVTSKTSYDNIRAWLSEIREHANDDVVITLLGNKSDCENERAVKKEEGERLAREYKVPFMETSAKTGLNVELAFLTVARNLIRSDRGNSDRDNNKFNVQDFVNEKSHHISCSSSGCLT